MTDPAFPGRFRAFQAALIRLAIRLGIAIFRLGFDA